MSVQERPHIVILGAGVGGVTAAYEARKKNKNAKITVVNPTSHFDFIPSGPARGAGLRTSKQIRVNLNKPFGKKDINLVKGLAEGIMPEKNQVETTAGDVIDYDSLVIATGPAHKWSAVPGMEEHTCSICSIKEAEDAYEKLKVFLEKPGPIVVGISPGASCAGPAYEQAFILDSVLRKLKVRDEHPIRFFTPEPDLGNFGIGGIANSKEALELEMKKREIEWFCNARADSFEQTDGGSFVANISELSDNGAKLESHSIPYNYGIMIPPFEGVSPFQDNLLAGRLVDDQGFIIVDEYQTNPEYGNIFAAGICTAKERAIDAAVPIGVPTTGLHIEGMAEAAISNIFNVLKGKESDHVATSNVMCLVEGGHNGFASLIMPLRPPHEHATLIEGRAIHYLKNVFEAHYLGKTAGSPFFAAFEKAALKLLGIPVTKLKEVKVKDESPDIRMSLG